MSRHPFLNGVKPFDQAALEQGINFAVYADNGTGKTGFVSTSPDAMILNADPGGVVTAASMGHKGDFKNMGGWADMEQAEDFFRNAPEAKGYKWCWLDSVSLFQDVGLENIMTELHIRKPHREIWHPDKGEYGENMNRLKLFVRHMASLPINFGFTAHPFLFESPDTGESQFLPWVQGKGMPNTLCGMCNVIGYLTIGKVAGSSDPKTMMYFKKRKNYYAKDRFGALPPVMVDPTVPKIEALISKRLREMSNGNGPRKAVAKRAGVKKAVAKKAVAR